MVTVRLELLPPNRMFATSTTFVFELVADRANPAAGVSASPIVNATGPTAVSSGVDCDEMLEMTGGEFTAKIVVTELFDASGSTDAEETVATFVHEPAVAAVA